jgi:hypothetical protein
VRAEFGHVICEDRGIVAGAGDGDVAEEGVEQVGVDAGIGVDENAFGGEPLGAVTGNGVAVVEMTMIVGVEFHLAVVVEADGQATIGSGSPRSRPRRDLRRRVICSGAVNWTRSLTEKSRSIS